MKIDIDQLKQLIKENLGGLPADPEALKAIDPVDAENVLAKLPTRDLLNLFTEPQILQIYQIYLQGRGQ
jgi:hypothetical protein